MTNTIHLGTNRLSAFGFASPPLPFRFSASLREAPRDSIKDLQPPTYAKSTCSHASKKSEKGSAATLRPLWYGLRFRLSAFRIGPSTFDFRTFDSVGHSSPLPHLPTFPFGKHSQNSQPIARRQLTSIHFPASHPKIKKGKRLILHRSSFPRLAARDSITETHAYE